MVGWNYGRGCGFNANNGMPFFFQNEGFFCVTSMITAVKRVHFCCLILSLFIQAQKKELLISFVWVRCCGSVCEFWVSISRSFGQPRRGLSAVTYCRSRAKSPRFPLLWRSCVLKVNGIASSVFCVLKIKFLCRARAWEAVVDPVFLLNWISLEKKHAFFVGGKLHYPEAFV